MITIPTYAGTTMCAANDTVAVVLDPSINSTRAGRDPTIGTWWVAHPYGTISGIAASINRQANNYEVISKLTDTDNEGNAKIITGGEKYGKQCWCRMTHPAQSKWIYNHAATQNNRECLSGCAEMLNNQHYQTDLRIGMFGSIEN